MLIFYKHTSFRSVFTCFSSHFHLYNPISSSLNPIFIFFFTYDSYIHIVFTPLNFIFIHLYSIKFKFYCCFRYFSHFITAFSCLDGTKKQTVHLLSVLKNFWMVYLPIFVCIYSSSLFLLFSISIRCLIWGPATWIKITTIKIIPFTASLIKEFIFKAIMILSITV